MATILTLDKDTRSIELTKEALEDKPYTLLSAVDKTEALVLLKQKNPAVLIIDIQMADTDGLELLEKISQSCPTTEIIVFTAKKGLDMTLKKIGGGKLDYLIKPDDYFKLNFVVNKALAKQEQKKKYLVLESTVIEKNDEINYRKKIESELRKFSTAVEQCRSSIIITDTQGNIEYANPKFFEVSGYRKEEVNGKTPRILKSGKTSSEEYEELWKKITSGKSWHGEFCNKNKSGELYWELASITPIRDESGEVTHFLALKEDITIRKQAEKQLDLQNQQLIQSDKMSSIGTLAAGVAHEINNPLNVAIGDIFLFRRDFDDMLGFITKISNLPYPEELKKSFCEIRDRFHLSEILGAVEDKLNRCTEAMERISSIVKRLRVFSHIDTEEIMEVDLNKSLTSTLDMVPKSHKQEIVITRNFAELPLVPLNGGEINQVFMNIFVNACQAMEGKGELTISTWVDSSCVHCSISDTGPGIPENKIDQIFNPFYTSKKIGEGTGLGLSISYTIIKNHGGTLVARNNDDTGVTFKVTLPVKGIEKVQETTGTKYL